MKNVLITCGPIPARLDSVKLITNQFKGGLAFETARYLLERYGKLTLVKFTGTPLPDDLSERYGLDLDVIDVHDVQEYYDIIAANACKFDAFVMAAAVANLMPAEPVNGKFPSHKYAPGDVFDIKFTLAPRAIDAIKTLNPRACVIGYKLFDGTDGELIDAARKTLRDSKANIIFANRPDTAKNKKLALTQDGACIPMDFKQHLDFMCDAIDQEYFKTEITPLTEAEQADPAIQAALARVEMYENTVPEHGAVAIPVSGHCGMFATTSRGHAGKPVLVRSVDVPGRIVKASGKATLNAPALAGIMAHLKEPRVIVHRHKGDPAYPRKEYLALEAGNDRDGYLFPGTVAEMQAVTTEAMQKRWNEGVPVGFRHHGCIYTRPILPVDWAKYDKTFPDRYKRPVKAIDRLVDACRDRGQVEILEVGGGLHPTAKYAYDKYVKADTACNVKWNAIAQDADEGYVLFDLVVCRNAVNYLTPDEIKTVLKAGKMFIANTFLTPPARKVRDNEAAVLKFNKDGPDTIMHSLRMPDDSLVWHEFFAYGSSDWKALGLTLTPYGENSVLLTHRLTDSEIQTLMED